MIPSSSTSSLLNLYTSPYATGFPTRANSYDSLCISETGDDLDGSDFSSSGISKLSTLELQKRREEIDGELEKNVSEWQFQQIQEICVSSSSPDEVSRNLLGYAEYIKREGFETSSEHVAQWAFHKSFLSICKKEGGGVEAYLNKANELEACRLELSSFQAQKIPPSCIGKLVKLYSSASKGEFKRPYEVTVLERAVQAFLEERIFNPRLDALLDNNSFYVWVRVEEEGISLTCCPKGIEESLELIPAASLFIPNDSKEIISPKACTVTRANKAYCQQKMENHQKVALLEGANTYISPATVYLGSPSFIRADPSFHNLQERLQNPVVYMAISSRLHVCIHILKAVEVLAKGGFVCLSLCPKDVIVRKGGTAKLDNVFHLKSLSTDLRNTHHESLDVQTLNAVAQKGHVSLDTDRYRLIVFICGIIFLNPDKELTLDPLEWENQVLEGVKSRVAPTLYKAIADAKSKLSGFNGKCLDVLKSIYKVEKEIGTADEPLFRQFIFQLVLFQILTPLLSETLSIENLHKDLLEQGKSPEEILSNHPMPSLEEIQKILEEGRQKLIEWTTRLDT